MNYLVEFHKHFSGHSNKENATYMEAYMKDKFQFLGIRSQERNLLLSEFISRYGKPTPETIEGIMIGLYSFPYREYHYCAIDLFRKIMRKPNQDYIYIIEYMLEYHQWWDTVDSIASNLVGPVFAKYGDTRDQYFEKWINSSDMWLNRTAIIFQLKYGNKTNTELLTRSIEPHIHSKEFFHRKAIGWALRQYSKFNPDWVRTFVSDHPDLSKLSVSEATKYL